MNSNFIAALQKATHLVRGQNLDEATRLIQTALAGVKTRADGPGLSATLQRPPSSRLFQRDRYLAERPRLKQADKGNALAQAAPGLADFTKTQAFPAFSGGLNPLAMPGRVVPVAPLPQGASFQARSFTCGAGTRGYKLYIPGCPPAAVRGLIIMLHGCRQNPDDFAVGTNMNAVAEANGLMVAYPGQTSSANASSCWNWFSPADQVRDSGEPSIIAGLALEIMQECAIDRSRVFVAGLSAGGAMAAILGETYPEIFSAVGVHSGLPCGSAHDVVSAFSAMRGAAPAGTVKYRSAATGNARSPRTIIFHGSADRTVYPANADRIAAAASRSSAPLSATKMSRGHDNGHDYSRTFVVDADGRLVVENWLVEGAGHAWSGGKPGGSFTNQRGPDASAHMVRFFLEAPFLDAETEF